jgi:hypothetical protein
MFILLEQWMKNIEGTHQSPDWKLKQILMREPMLHQEHLKIAAPFV